MDFATSQPLPTSVSRGGERSDGPERLEAKLGEAFLAGGFVTDVVHDVVLGAGHAEEVRESGRPSAELQGPGRSS